MLSGQTLKFRSGAPDVNVNFVKSILPNLGNITEFEVYYEESPYIVEEDGRKNEYTFILRDDQENELWLYSLCGYGGSGPQATKEILQILGLKDDYQISERKIIKETNLKPIHDLRLIVFTHHEKILGEPEIRFMVESSFQYAYQLHSAKNALKCFGDLYAELDDHPHRSRTLFHGYETGKKEWYEYATNNRLIFDREYTTCTTDRLKAILNSIISANKGTFDLIEMKSKI
jgi:hypothetical protein